MSRLDANPRTSLSPIPRIGQQVAIQSQPLSVPRPLSAGAQQAEEFLAAIGYGVGALAQAAQNENESVRRNEVVHRGEAAKNSSMVLQETYTAIDDKKIDIPTTDEGVHTLVGQLVEKATAGQNEAYADEMRYRITDHLYAALSQARQANAAAVRKETLSAGGSQLVGAVGGDRIDSTLEYFKGLGATQDETDQMLLEAMQADLINGDLAAVREKLPYIGDRHPIEIAKLNAGIARVESDNAQAAQENATQRAAYWTDQAEQGKVLWDAAESRIRKELANDPKAMLAAVEHLRVQRDKAASEATQQANANRAAIIDRSKNTVAAHIAKGEFDLADAYISKSTRDPDAPFSGDKPLDATDALELSSKVKAAREAAMGARKQDDIRFQQTQYINSVRGMMRSANVTGGAASVEDLQTGIEGADIKREKAIELATDIEFQEIDAKYPNAANDPQEGIRALSEKIQFLSNNGITYKPWQRMLDAGYMTAQSDFGAVGPNGQPAPLPVNLQQGYSLFKALDKANPKLAGKQADAKSVEFYKAAMLAEKYSSPGNPEGALFTAISGYSNPDLADSISHSIDGNLLRSTVESTMTQDPGWLSWERTGRNTTEISSEIERLARQYMVVSRVGMDAAVEEAAKRVSETHAVINDWMIYTGNTNLTDQGFTPTDLNTITRAMAQAYVEQHPDEPSTADDLTFKPIEQDGSRFVLYNKTSLTYAEDYRNGWILDAKDFKKYWIAASVANAQTTADDFTKRMHELITTRKNPPNRFTGNDGGPYYDPSTAYQPIGSGN